MIIAGLWESPWKKGYVGVVCGRSPQTTPTYGPYHGRSQRDIIAREVGEVIKSGVEAFQVPFLPGGAR